MVGWQALICSVYCAGLALDANVEGCYCKNCMVFLSFSAAAILMYGSSLQVGV